MQPRMNFFQRLWRVAYPLLIWFGISIMVESVFMIIPAVQAFSEPDVFHSFELTDRALEYVLDWTLENSLLITLVSDAIAAVVLFMFCLLDGRGKEKNSPLKSFTVKKPLAFIVCLCTAVASCILFEVVLSFIVSVVTTFGGTTESFDEVSDIISNSGMLMQVITVVVVGPICEEMLMRAVIYRRMRTCHGFWFSAIASAAIFGVIHGNWVQFVYAFIVGFIIAYVYEMTGNLLMPIIFHMTINGISTLMGTEALGPYFENLMYGPIMGITFIVCGAAIATGMLALRKYRDCEKEKLENLRKSY